MKKVQIDTTLINDWPSFHQLFFEVMGFFDFYGNNMDAWIDCMSCIVDPDSDLTVVKIRPGEMLFIEVLETEDFNKHYPNQFDALVECTAVLNKRTQEPIIALVFL